MKLLVGPRILIVAIVIVIVGAKMLLNRGEVPIREGRVEIDSALLDRLRTEDETTTRDLAVKALSATQFKGELLLNMLRTGSVTVDVHRVDRDSVRVTVWETFSQESSRFTVSEYTRYRLAWWVLFSPRSWKEMILHKPYWVSPSYNEWMRYQYE